MAETAQCGIAVDHCILDAGCCSGGNMENLNAAVAPVSYVIRLKAEIAIYGSLVRDHALALASPRNAVIYGKRAAFIRCAPINFNGGDAFAYVTIDHAVQADEQSRMLRKKEADFGSPEEREREILPLHYMRQSIGQVFDCSEDYAGILPLSTHEDETFRGRLLILFMTAIAIMALDKMLQSAHPRSKKPKFNFLQAKSNLRQTKCDVYDNSVVLPILPDANSRLIMENL
ncbi:MAG: hypothetical protein LBU32_17930 [Clostridiales bacterium]|jgi:hypothetical protein|nr:hypothetical protein [Clostridiales bacterium]